MKAVRPEGTEPIPARAVSPHRMGTIILRFVTLLAAAVLAMMLVWYR